jgi:hypothetical protein
MFTVAPRPSFVYEHDRCRLVGLAARKLRRLGGQEASPRRNSQGFNTSFMRAGWRLCCSCRSSRYKGFDRNATKTMQTPPWKKDLVNYPPIGGCRDLVHPFSGSRIADRSRFGVHPQHLKPLKLQIKTLWTHHLCNALSLSLCLCVCLYASNCLCVHVPMFDRKSRSSSTRGICDLLLVVVGCAQSEYTWTIKFCTTC